MHEATGMVPECIALGEEVAKNGFSVYLPLYALWQPNSCRRAVNRLASVTGHQQAMRVLLQSAIAYLGKAEHPLDDPDRMFDPGPHFGLGAVFPPRWGRRCTA